MWELQESLRERVLAGDASSERLLLVEHEPVLTLGRSADRAHLLAAPAELAARGVDVVDTSRGGDVTAHGPGQLVIYPVVRVRGVVAYLEAIAGAIASALAAHGIAAAWSRAPAGVWIADAKIAACGIHLKRRVAIHGFALNVTNEILPLFATIVPCGLASARVTTVEAERPPGRQAPSVEQLAEELAPRVTAALGRRAAW